MPWDQELQNSKAVADTLVGRDPLVLLQSYDEIGPEKSAQQIADLLVARIQHLGEAYHETEEGQPPVTTRTFLDKSRDPWEYRVDLKLEKT